MIVDIEYIKHLKRELNKINKAQLYTLDFYENGNKIIIKDKVKKEFEYYGLNNVDFILSGFYKGSDDE